MQHYPEKDVQRECGDDEANCNANGSMLRKQVQYIGQYFTNGLTKGTSLHTELT